MARLAWQLLIFMAAAAIFHACGSPLNKAANSPTLLPKPPITEYAAVARWACARAHFGTLSTISVRLKQAPWGNIASVSDGIHSDLDSGTSTGIPYFYLTKLDESARDLKADPRASFTISQATFPDAHFCRERSAEDPTCVRLTLYGKVLPVPPNSKEYAFGLKSLYSKHPTMEGWPRNHSFSVYAMRVEDVFMLDNYGGSHKITVTDYLNNTYYDKLNRGFQKKHLDEVAQV